MMETKTKKVILGCAAAVVVGYLGTVAYVYFYDRQRPPAVTGNPISVFLTERGCDYCHTAAAGMPFYASLPIAKQLMEADVATGLKSFRLDQTLEALRSNGAAPEVDLAKIEAVNARDEMPPALYKVMHWNGGLSAQDLRVVQEWIVAQRKQYYTPAGTPAALQGQAILPLPASVPTDPRKVALGFRLYHDPRLSKDNTVPCAHCHKLEAGGVDGLKTSLGVGDQVGPINAPTVFNAVFNIAQFWDGRAKTLQDQAGGPPLNPIEMASSSWEEIIAKLVQDTALKEEFERVYPEGFSGDTITNAIAEFEKTLITPDSPFDLFLKGDQNALTAQQKHGWQLFQQNKCGTCHTGVILGGQSYEIMGLKADYFTPRGGLTDVDLGRYAVTKDEYDRHRFKTPTLRNVALTAPYFHDGSIKTLHEAVKYMLKHQVGVSLPDSDVNALVALQEGMSGKYQPYQPSARPAN
jgi:cytochrome c peroxidase